MSQCPSPVDAESLEALGIAVVAKAEEE